MKNKNSNIIFILFYKLIYIEKTFVFDLDETLVHCNDDLS